MPRLLLKFQSILFRIMPEKSFLGSGIMKNDMLCLTSSMVALDFEKDLDNILCPALIICGKNSNAELSLIDNAGHEINIAAPKKLANAMNCFFQNR